MLVRTRPYLYVSCSGSITSVGEERVNLSAIVYLQLCGFCSERCLGQAALFYCGTPWAFHIIISLFKDGAVC